MAASTLKLDLVNPLLRVRMNLLGFKPDSIACAVHYVGKHKEDDSVFIDTKNEKGGEPVSVVAGRGAHPTPYPSKNLNNPLLHCDSCYLMHSVGYVLTFRTLQF